MTRYIIYVLTLLAAWLLWIVMEVK